MTSQITEEWLAAQTPEVQAVIRHLLAELARLQEQVRKLTLQNSSLPVIQPEVTEYRRRRLTCPCCGKTTCAPLPAHVPGDKSGPRLVAFTGLLMGHFRRSKRRAALFPQDLLGVPCCPAITVKMQKQVSAALQKPYDRLKAKLDAEPHLNMNETSSKQANQKAGQWTFVDV